MRSLSLVRSLLFTPADRPDRFGKAADLGADGAVLDLEDGVGLPLKQKAREAALRFFEAPTPAPPDSIWAVRLNRIQLRKISMFGAALVLVAAGAWAIATTPRVVASTPVGIDPFQMMTTARDLPAAHYVDDSLIFN